jgi:TrmH family RNA methyltransferase
MGTIFWKILVQTSFNQFIDWVRANNYQLIGSSAHSYTDYREFRRNNKQAILLMGSEQKGLSQDQLAACDLTLTLPMQGRVSSLNLAVSAGILLYAIKE